MYKVPALEYCWMGRKIILDGASTQKKICTHKNECIELKNIEL